MVQPSKLLIISGFSAFTEWLEPTKNFFWLFSSFSFLALTFFLLLLACCSCFNVIDKFCNDVLYKESHVNQNVEQNLSPKLLIDQLLMKKVYSLCFLVVLIRGASFSVACWPNPTKLWCRCLSLVVILLSSNVMGTSFFTNKATFWSFWCAVLAHIRVENHLTPLGFGDSRALLKTTYLVILLPIGNLFSSCADGKNKAILEYNKMLCWFEKRTCIFKAKIRVKIKYLL